MDPGNTQAQDREEFFYHTKESKRAPFEDGLRTPILFRWDKHIAPGRHELLCNSIDIAQTLLHLTGETQKARAPPGINLLDKETRKRNADRAVFGEIYPGDAVSLGRPSRNVAYRWVRQGNFKLIIPRGNNPWGDYLSKSALFNLAKDPDEKENLRLRVSSRTHAKALRRLLENWWQPGNDAAVPKPPVN